MPQEPAAPDKEYWLYHGQAIPKTNDTPPWPPAGFALGQRREVETAGVLRPDRSGCRRQRDALVSHRRGCRRARPKERSPRRETAAGDTTPNDLGWKAIRLEGVETYPHRINPLSLLPDGRLYGTGDDYVGTFLFDPRTDQTTYCGPRVGLAPYTTIVCGGKLYLSGYSGGHLFVFDPARDWTLGKGGPPGHPAPDQADVEE